MLVPPGSSERADFLHDLAYRTEPSFDFFVYSLLAGLTLSAALLLDSPGLVVLAALLSPFMAPVVGISLGTITGSLQFVLQSLGSLGIGSLIVFLCGAVAGWAVNLIPAHLYQQAFYHSHLIWPDFFVVGLGAALTSYLLVRSPNQRPLVTSVAIAYGLYLPAGTAGFGLTSGVAGLWPDGLWLFVINLVLAILVGMLVFGFLGLRPLNASGYLLGAVYLLAGIALVATFYRPLTTLPTPAATLIPTTTQMSVLQEPTALAPTTPTAPASSNPAAPTRTPTITPTHTLVPTGTPTLTVTPQPTPVWARIAVPGSDGALIRVKPSYTSEVVTSIINGALVEVFADEVNAEGVNWVHIRTTNDKEGWIVRSLLRTATPTP